METEILCADPQIVVCLKPVGIDSEQGMCALLREQLSGSRYRFSAFGIFLIENICIVCEPYPAASRSHRAQKMISV